MAKSIPTIQQTEMRVPQLARAATRSAYNEVLASGSSVLISKNGKIREISPSGKSSFVKDTEPRIKIQKGSIIRIK